MAAAAFRRNLRYKERMSLRSRSRDISPFDYKRVHRARESDDSSNDEFGRRKRRERSKEKSPKKRKKRRKVSSNSKERKIRKKSKKKSKKNERSRQRFNFFLSKGNVKRNCSFCFQPIAFNRTFKEEQEKRNERKEKQKEKFPADQREREVQVEFVRAKAELIER